MAHEGPLHAYSQLPYSNTYKPFVDLQEPDVIVPLPTKPNFGAPIIKDKEKVTKAVKVLK